MKRYGPLIAVADTLVLGDPGRNHLRLTPEAVVVRAGADNRGIIPWREVTGIDIDVPTTRFRLPGLVGTILLGAASTFALSADLGVEPDDGSVTITTHDGRTEFPLSRHHVGGYWTRTVEGAHRLIRHLIDTPEQRALLAAPGSLVDIAAALARR